MRTTKVKMLATESGRYEGWTESGGYHCLTGHEYDVPADLAKAWIAQGIAEPVKQKRTTTGKTKGRAT